MLSLIGIAIFVLSQLIYDYASVEAMSNAAMGETVSATRWSIFYFSSIYLSFILIAFDVMYKETSKAIAYSSASMGLYLLFMFIWELSFVNVPFDEYIIKVNSTNVTITCGITLSILLIFVSLKAWEKRRGKHSQRHY